MSSSPRSRQCSLTGQCPASLLFPGFISNRLRSYAECSLPCCVFEVEVFNTSSADLEVGSSSEGLPPLISSQCSVMFVWENSDGQKRELVDPVEKGTGSVHEAFTIAGPQTVVGVCQSHHHITRVRHSNAIPQLFEVNDTAAHPTNPQTSTGEEQLLDRNESSSAPAAAGGAPWNPFGCSQTASLDCIFCDQVRFSSMTVSPSRRDRWHSPLS
jgi:hypothetical protein